MERAIAKFLYGASTKQAASKSGYRVSNNLNKKESWPGENRAQFKKRRSTEVFMHTRTNGEWAQGEARVARWHCCRTRLLVSVDLIKNMDQQRDAAAEVGVPAGPSPAGHVK